MSKTRLHRRPGRGTHDPAHALQHDRADQHATRHPSRTPPTSPATAPRRPRRSAHRPPRRPQGRPASSSAPVPWRPAAARPSRRSAAGRPRAAPQRHLVGQGHLRGHLGASTAAAGGTPTSEVPVGGGKVFADTKTVVTQPTAGTFKAFDAMCPHQGCTVGSSRAARSSAPATRATSTSTHRRPDPRPAAPTGLTAKKITVTGSTFTVSLTRAPRVGASSARGGPAASVARHRVEAWRTRRPTDRSRGRSRPTRASTGSATRTAGSSTSARRSPCARGCPPTSRTSPRCTRAPRRWSRRPRRSSGPSCAPRSRRCSSSTPGSRSSTRASTSSTATTSPTPSSP